ncbi:hypothetical protein Pmani_014060 [Petrolisthes manimaculis]|uniref:RGS domain-containing protein n=1 Tax=Petrolisthes manimaculis TaxID=1843537 RepID=A0AAE1PX76_9EUCA|nr:hypothetical protein Pmani_014060 [Petrolisthes manimaculis]
MSSAQKTSAQATKPEKKKKDTKTDDKAKAEKKGPTKTQLEKWTSSINGLLSDPDGIKEFRQFLENKEGDDEKGELTKYIDFYIECEEFKYNFKSLEEKAMKIFEKYLAVGADQELPAGDDCTEIGDKLDDEGLEGVTLFDKPQNTIRKTIADGLYVDFCLDIKNKLKI